MPFTPMAAMDSTPTWIQQADDYVVTNAAAAAIALPSAGYRLVKVQVVAGALHGYLKIVYDGIAAAYFPAMSNGTNGVMSWALTWNFKGNNLPVALFTYSPAANGTAAPIAVTYTFSKGKSRGPDISNYRSIPFTLSSAGVEATVTTMGTVTYDVGPAVPTGMIALSTSMAAGAMAYWPQIGAAQSGHPTDSAQGSMTIGVAPPLPKAQTLITYYTDLAACKLLYIVGYDPIA